MRRRQRCARTSALTSVSSRLGFRVGAATPSGIMISLRPPRRCSRIGMRMFSYLIRMSTRPGTPPACAPPPAGLAAGGQARISYHCPIAVVFESNEPVAPADAMAGATRPPGGGADQIGRHQGRRRRPAGVGGPRLHGSRARGWIRVVAIGIAGNNRPSCLDSCTPNASRVIPKTPSRRATQSRRNPGSRRCGHAIR